MENAYYRRVKAIFQLCEKLKRSRVTIPANSVSKDPATSLDEEVMMENLKVVTVICELVLGDAGLTISS
jgi:hypothetical protein